MVTPGRPPLALVIVEFGKGTLGVIGPGLGSDTVSEVVGSSSDGKVENQVVGTVERSILVLGVLPRV